MFQNDSSPSVDVDMQEEYARQREHLERSVASLRKKLEKDNEIHRADNVRIMQVSYKRNENISCVKENIQCLCNIQFTYDFF